MRRSTKLFGALAAAALVTAGASAYTASSTIDNAAKHVGAVAQTISGVTVTNVQYTIDPATDATTKVDFHVSQALTSTDVITSTITGTAGTGGATESVACGQTLIGILGADGTDLACTYNTAVTNVTGLAIVAS
jgi:hypothetical protein